MANGSTDEVKLFT